MARVYGIKRQPGEKLFVSSSGKTRVWFCDGCDTPFEWDEDSLMYGSILDRENENWDAIWIACCLQCANERPSDFPPKGVKSKRFGSGDGGF